MYKSGSGYSQKVNGDILRLAIGVVIGFATGFGVCWWFLS